MSLPLGRNISARQPYSVLSDAATLAYWGAPVWRDEMADRQAFGTAIDPSKWNLRNTEVNNFDYAVVDSSMVYADTAGRMHITADWLTTPSLVQQGGSSTAASADNVITTTSNHGFAAEAKIYVEVVTGTGISTGYYYVKTTPSATTLTLTETCDMWPGGLGAELSITSDTTVKLYRPRFMKTGYVDHRAIAGYPSITPIEQQYGRWEIKCKPPSSPTTGRGVLAAFWLRNSGTITVGGNAGAEIDIMESWGSGPDPKYNPGTSTLTGFRYTSVPSGGTQWKSQYLYDDTLNDAYADFHVWAFERTPDYVAAYRDGIRTAYQTPTSEPEWWESTFTNPFHVRLNMHMGAGARYWGIPDIFNKSWTATPTDFQVEYVRIWSYPG